MRKCSVVFLVAAVFFQLSILFPHTAEAIEAQEVKIAVLPFEINASDDLQYLRESLPELLADRLSNAGFSVISQEAVKSAILDKGLASLAEADASELALLTGANYAVYGSFSQLGETLSLDARLVDAFNLQTPEALYVTKEGLISLLPAVEELADIVKSTLLKEDKIAEIKVEGTRVLDSDVILSRLSVKEGDLYDPKMMNEQLKNIYDLGYFEDIQIKVDSSRRGRVVTFKVEEKPRIQFLDIKGTDEIDSDDIIANISTKSGAILNPKVLAMDIRTIRGMYHKEGYYKATISHEVVDMKNGQARLVFDINEGPRLYIEDIQIDGAKQVDVDDLKSLLSLKEHGILSLFTDEGILDDDFLERDGSVLASYYRNHGFLDARIGEPDVDIRDDGIYVTYKVYEGSRFKVNKVEFAGDLITSTEELGAVIGADELESQKEFLDRSVVNSDMDNLTEYYNNQGYAYATVDVQMKDDRENSTVDLVYNVVKHQRIKIRRIVLEGNTKTRDNVIMRELELADGDRYSKSLINRSTMRLDRLDYFGNVSIDTIPTGDPNEVDMKVKVAEKGTGKIGGGAGFSTYDGVFIGGNLAEDNLFGKGYQGALDLQLASKGTKFQLNFYNPRYDDTLLGVGGAAFLTTHEYDQYTRDSVGGNVRLGYPIGRYTTVNGSYNLENYEIKDIETSASQDLKDEEGTHLLSSVRLSAVRDTTDSKRYARLGTKSVVGLEVAGGMFGGDDSFVRYKAEHDWYKTLVGDLVFHWKNRIGLMTENIDSKDIPENELYQIGGPNTVRGYSRDKIGPQDSDGKTVGGNKQFITNLELLYLMSKEYGIVGVAFFDAGGVWDQGDSYFSSPSYLHSTYPAMGLYKSIGAGIRWDSPLGPLRVEYGYGLDELYDSASSRIEFSMGTAF
ncbi:MAG: outer membrane protein assembly factor BamA [Desulfovibrio sp.]